jgi:hypothetical protein
MEVDGQLEGDDLGRQCRWGHLPRPLTIDKNALGSPKFLKLGDPSVLETLLIR